MIFPPEKTLPQLFEDQVNQTPDHIALVFQEQALTYVELNAAADRLAAFLRQRRLQPGQPVALYLERSIEMVIAILGVLKAGGAYLPLDPAYPIERLHFILNDAQVNFLVTSSNPSDRITTPTSIEVIEIQQALAAESLDNSSDILPIRIDPQQVAYIIYTSGSTGQPKGAMVSHYNVVRLFQATQDWFHFDSHDVWTLFHSFAFDFSVWELWGALLYGGRLVITPYEISRTPKAFIDLLREQKITVLNQTPSAFMQLLSNPEFADPANTASLRYVIFGGEALYPSTLRPWMEQRGDEHPRLVNMYGITETTVHVTYRPLRMQDLDSPASAIGIPIPDLQVLLLDEALQPVAPGESGEVFVGGAGVCLGYLQRPELNAQRFIDLPTSLASQDGKDRKRFYKSGDLARYDEHGELEYLGRADFQIKLRGFRIELGEIESVLSSHPAIHHAAVLLKEGPTVGENRLVAYLILSDQAQISVSELRNYLKTKLPEYMLPTSYVALEAFPITPNGKLDRSALPEPQDDRPALLIPFRPAQDDTQQALLSIWQEVLGLKQIGIDDDFFELGGHSLAFTQIATRIQERLGQEVSIWQIFDHSTVASLAQVLQTSQSKRSPSHRLTIERVPRLSAHPLSFSQEQVWVLQELAPHNLAYNSQETIHFTGALDYQVLSKALSEIVRRHEIMRTTFEIRADQPAQIIHEPWKVDLSVLDLSQLASDEKNAALVNAIDHAFNEPFDVARLPLIRWRLIKLAPEEHILIHVEHHFIHDGWSFSILMRDLKRFYTAFAQNLPVVTTPPSIQYVDFVAWQRRMLSEGYLAAHIRYWKDRLADHPPVLELPYDQPRPARKSFQGASHRLNLPSEIYEQAKALSLNEDATLYVVLLTAFLALLYRYTGQKDLLIGSGFANRRLPGLEDVVGMIVNPVVLRTDLTGNPTLRELLQRARQVFAEAYNHQDLPFEKLVQLLQPERVHNINPFFQVMFSFHDSPVPELDLGEVKGHIEYRQNDSAKFDLNVVVIPRREQLLGRDDRAAAADTLMIWEFDTDLFEPQTIQRMADHFQNLLKNMLANPDWHISEIPLLSAEEEQRLLVEWNQTRRAYPSQTSIHKLFEQQAAQTPDACALSFQGKRMTYAELNRKANQIAHLLQERSLALEQPVVLFMQRSFDMVIAMLAILKAGGCYVPLDPAYPFERLAFMVQDSGAKIALTQEHLRPSIASTGVEQIITLTANSAEIARQSPENLHLPHHSDNLAYIIYTSGSTGRPKGTLIPHRAVVRLAINNTFANLSADEVFLQFAPITFDASTFEIWGALLNGAYLVIYPAPGGATSLAELQQVIVENGVTVAWLTAGLFHQVVDEQPDLIRNLRQLLAGGEALSVTQVRKALQIASDCQLINGYGPTENTTFTCCYPIHKLETWQTTTPIGYPIANTTVYILDENLKPVPIGVPGELYIGGDGLARGYLNQPELTAEKFIPNPFPGHTSECLYRSGDRARYLPDGAVEFLGRLDGQVKLRGFRIELGEIEAVLEEHPRVRQAAVVLSEKPSTDHGQSEKRLVAYLRAEVGDGPSDDELVAFLQARLPAYMLPRIFVTLAEIPLTPNGKVDRQALPVPESHSPIAATRLPESTVEISLAELWNDLLQVKSVGVEDNFFHLGGHSLMASQLLARVRRQWDVEIKMIEFFENPTIASMAELVIERSQISSHPGREEGEI
jgi:amino acid adenylation domain-containing protein